MHIVSYPTRILKNGTLVLFTETGKNLLILGRLLTFDCRQMEYEVIYENGKGEAYLQNIKHHNIVEVLV